MPEATPQATSQATPAARLPSEVAGPAIERVLQVMYFCDAEYVGRAHPEAPVIGTAVTFEGSVNGVFRMMVSEARAAQLAADFLALDVSEVGSDHIEATVKEFANIACGATMSAWIPSADLHFSVPREFSAEDECGGLPHCFSVAGGAPEIAVDVLFR